MRLSDVLALVEEATRGGYYVHFERRRDGLLRSDYVPEPKIEPPIDSLEDAWSLAEAIARVVPSAVNIYPVRANTYRPVLGYEERRLKTYPPRNPG